MNDPAALSPITRSAGEMALIFAAERLFAQHGIAGVSLRQINQAANQKNISAAHYHFGSREGLAAAVLEHRWLGLDRRRYDRMATGGGRRDLRFYVEVLIATLAEELEPRPEGNHYLRFVHQYEHFRGGQQAARDMSPAGVQIYARIEAMIAEVPQAIREIRMRYLVNLVHGVLAAAERQLEFGEFDHAGVPLIVSNLVDMTAAALAAPASPGTAGMLGLLGAASGPGGD